jgi:AAA15 family ATPase/GTPase
MGLSEDIKEIKDELLKKKKEEEEVKEKKKEFKIPFFKRVNPKQASKGYVTVMKINENGFLDFQKEKIVEQTTMIDGIPRLATPEYVLHWKKNPVIIQPSWSVKPFSPEVMSKSSLLDGSNTKGYKILMARMKSDTVGTKAPMGGMMKWIIGIALAAIVGYALISGGGS